MKAYKSFLMVLMVFVLSILMSGCIIIPRSTYYDIPAEEVVSVHFYDLRIQRAANYSGFDTTLEPVYTISEEEKETFLDDFSNLKFSDPIVIVLAAIDPSFSYGDWVIRINFTNGRYTLYSSAGYSETFDAEDHCISYTHFSCDDEDLDNFICKYYKTE